MPNPFAHIELTSDNLKDARKFYSKLFAWKLIDLPDGSYVILDVGEGTGGGMQSKPMPDAPTGWLPYVHVDSVKATMAKAVKAGAKALLPFMDIGEHGAIGIFADPQGVKLGIWEKGTANKIAEKATKKAAKKSTVKKAVAKKAVAKKAVAKKAIAKKATKKPAATTSIARKKTTKKK